MFGIKIPVLTLIEWVVGFAFALVLGFSIYWLATSPGREAALRAKADAREQYDAARRQSERDAATITDLATRAQDGVEATSRENADEIRSACPGPDCNRVALDRLCQRPAYATSPQCVQRTSRPQPPR